MWLPVVPTVLCEVDTYMLKKLKRDMLDVFEMSFWGECCTFHELQDIFILKELPA